MAQRLRDVLQGMWDLPKLGIKPMSSALAGGFFPTDHLGSPPQNFFFVLIVSVKLYHSRKQIFLIRKTTLLTTTLTKGSQPLHTSLPGQVSTCL